MIVTPARSLLCTSRWSFSPRRVADAVPVACPTAKSDRLSSSETTSASTALLGTVSVASANPTYAPRARRAPALRAAPRFEQTSLWISIRQSRPAWTAAIAAARALGPCATTMIWRRRCVCARRQSRPSSRCGACASATGTTIETNGLRCLPGRRAPARESRRLTGIGSRRTARLRVGRTRDLNDTWQPSSRTDRRTSHANRVATMTSQRRVDPMRQSRPFSLR